MISFIFNIWFVIYLIFYFYCEVFFSILSVNLLKNFKNITLITTKTKQYNFLNKLSLNLILNLLFIYFFTLKIHNYNLMIIYVYIYILVIKFINNYFNQYVSIINLNIILFILLLNFINNLILFYLFIELYAIIFYFFFLNVNFNFKQLYLIQYKNSLLLYLFNNFLTSILYLVGVSGVIYHFGTVNFFELNFFNHINSHYILYCLILSFIFKLSLPGFHFLKIEIYKYLSIYNVIIFSTLTLYINFLLTIFFFNNTIIFFVINSYKILNLLILFIFFFFINKLKIYNFHEFVAYSGFATNNLILLNFII